MGDFPFVSPADRTTAVACLLLPFLRALIESGTPLHLIDKPAAGTGASLLAELIGVIATGRPPGVLSEANEAAEWGKCITAALLQSQTEILDAARPIPSATEPVREVINVISRRPRTKSALRDR